MLGFSRKTADSQAENVTESEGSQNTEIDTQVEEKTTETKKASFWNFGTKKPESKLSELESITSESEQSEQSQQLEAEIQETSEKKATKVFGFKIGGDDKASKQQGDIAEQQPQPKASLFQRLKKGLSRTRENFTTGLANLFSEKKAIDDDLLEEIETLLLTADVGVDATQLIIDNLHKRVAKDQLKESGELYTVLKQNMQELLEPVEQPLEIPDDLNAPYVILMVGINGAGKTTTIGKLAKRFQSEGKKVMLAAGDTFRAAAVEQLKIWGQRNDVMVIAQHDKADSAAVIFDALQSAKAKNIDVLIADTAGRLHTQNHLMDELKKIKKVMSRLDENAPHEVMLVLDASIGQNALNQAQQFNKAIGITGINITKLDGTAKGGIIFAVAHQLGLPIRFIGVGEQIDDLRVFNAQQFVEALLTMQEEQEG